MKFILVGLALAVVVGLGLATRKPDNPAIRRLGPSFFFWLSLVYLACCSLSRSPTTTPILGSRRTFPSSSRASCP